jgi:phosphatidylinositol alpha 1,6-mannosyltransferase
VGPQGSRLGREHVTDIHPVGDLAARGPCRVELGWIELRRCQAGHRGEVARAGDRFPRQGGLEQPRRRGAQHLSCPHSTMDRKMVRVPVPAGRVVADKDIGMLLVADGGDASTDGESAHVGEAVGVLPMQTRIGIAEHDGAGDSERFSGLRQLGATGGTEILGVLGGGETRLAIGGDHEDDAVPFSGGSCHGARGQQGLIVGMGVDEHEGACGHAGHCGVRSLGVRIAHVSDCFAPRTGGIESQVKALATRQSAAGQDVRVITATPGHEGVRSGLDVVDGLPVHRVTANLPFELPVHPRTRREVGRVLDADPVDVVHVHAGVVSPFAWGAIRAARERRLPVLVTVHSVWGPLARPAFGASEALARWSSWGVTLSAVSDLAAEHVRRAVPRSGPVLVVPNGIDPDQWHVTPGPTSSDRLRLVTVMRLAPRKRTLPLVQMIERAREGLNGSVDVTATIIGDGPMLQRARKDAASRGVADAIRFAGRLDRTAILEVFAQSDVYVQPSVKESFGLAALEARTAGLPVVARTQSGTTQFIHEGIEGLLAADDPGMVGALVRLGRDRALLDQLTEHNRTQPPQETWPDVLAPVDAASAPAGAGPSQH